jgi:glycosyltransferase involved in cell wall biosynthesis
VYRRALHRLLAQAAVGLTVSDDMRSRLLARGFAASKLRRHYIGVPDEILSPGPRTRRPQGAFRLLQVGRLAATKGHRISLAAVAECRPLMPSLSLRILGEGPLNAMLEAEHKRLALGTAVQFEGRRPSDAVLAAMREADALLSPSERDDTGRMEGLPIVIAEALAAGLPVIASHHAGIPEAVRYSAPDWLTAEGDVSAVADRIRRLASDAVLWNRCSREGWEWTDREFRLSRQCSRLQAMYARLTLPDAPA